MNVLRAMSCVRVCTRGPFTRVCTHTHAHARRRNCSRKDWPIRNLVFFTANFQVIQVLIRFEFGLNEQPLMPLGAMLEPDRYFVLNPLHAARWFRWGDGRCRSPFGQLKALKTTFKIYGESIGVLLFFLFEDRAMQWSHFAFWLKPNRTNNSQPANAIVTFAGLRHLQLDVSIWTN